MGGGDSNDAYGFDDSQNYYYSDNTNVSSPFAYDCDLSIGSGPGAAAVHYIPLVVFPLLLLQGIVGNLLAIPVLVSISRSAWSTVIYLACLAATDLIILLILCGRSWYMEVVGVDVSRQIMDSSDAACKAYVFAFTCIQHSNPWLVVAISIDTMIATRWPRKIYSMCTLERARYVLLLMSIIVVCLDINHFWTFGVPKPGLHCMYTEEFSEIFQNWIWPAMDNLISTFMPLSTATVCFFFTVSAKIRGQATLEKDLETQMKKYFMQLDTLRDFRLICFILCLLYMCLGFFKLTHSLTMFLHSQSFIDVECVTFSLFTTISMTFTFAFYATKIYLYLALSPMFRVKLKQGFMFTFRTIGSFCRTVKGCGNTWILIPQQTSKSLTPPNDSATSQRSQKSNIYKLATVQATRDETCEKNCRSLKSCNSKAPSSYSGNQPSDISMRESGTKV